MREQSGRNHRGLIRGGVLLALIILVLFGSCRQYTIVPYPVIDTDTDNQEPIPTTNAEKIKDGLGLAGSGTSENDPLIIKDSSQLESLGDYDTEGVYFVLQDDINLGGLSTLSASSRVGNDSLATNWTPIGTLDNPFRGTIAGAGDGITISGLVINESGNTAYGLFGYTDGATISDITIQGNITAPNSDKTALLVGQASNGTVISNCVAGVADTEAINQSTVSAGEAGGLVGKMIGSGTIENSKNYAMVTATGIDVDFKAGGIVQTSYYPVGGEEYPLNIINCENHGEINGGNHTGGIAGIATGTRIQNSDNYGRVSASYTFGGIVGSLKVGSAINTANNEGEIVITNKRSTFHNIGGIVGAVENRDVPYVGIISNVTNKKDITVESDVTGPIKSVGGIVGLVSNNAYVSGSNEGAINIPAATQVGGLVGSATGFTPGTSNRLMISGTNTGEIIAAQSVGGLVGETSGPITINGTNEASVTVKYIASDVYAGGIVGYMTGDDQRIEDVENSGDISVYDSESSEVSNPRRIGGIVGYIASSDAVIKEAVNTGDIKATGVIHVGGIIGENNNLGDSSADFTISNVSVKDVTIEGLDTIGGIIGYFNGGSITSEEVSETTYTVDNVKISSESHTGGAIGIAVNTGTVTGISVNGIEIALSGERLTTENHITRNRYTGGFVGHSYPDADYTYTSCSVSSGKICSSVEADIKHIGGFVGSAYSGTYTGCTVDGFEFESGRYGSMCGGFVGCADDSVNKFDNCKSEDVSATDTNVMGFVGSSSVADSSKYDDCSYNQGSGTVTADGFPTV